LSEPLAEPAGDPLDRDRADELQGGYSRRTVVWISLLCGLSFAAAVFFIAFGEELEGPSNPHANTFSKSALGHQGLAGLLDALGLGTVSRRGRGGAMPGPRRPLVLAEPDLALLAAGASRLDALAREAAEAGAPLVVVLPKWRGEPRPGRPEWIGEAHPLPVEALGQVFDSLGATELADLEVLRSAAGPRRCSASWTAGGGDADLRVDLEPAQLLPAGSGFEAVVSCRGGLLVARRTLSPSGAELFVVADPDLLNNHGLGRADHAALVHGLFSRRLGASGVIFDETIHGFRRPSGLIAEAFRFPLVLAVLQGFTLSGLVLWAGMGRFGKPLPARRGLRPGKEILIENTAKLLEGGGHAAEALERYFRQTLRAVAARYFLAPDLPEGETIARLQPLSKGKGLPLDLAAVAGRIRSLPRDRRSAEAAVGIAGSLYRWRQEMTSHVDRKSP
jgi:hypothetical protein